MVRDNAYYSKIFPQIEDGEWTMRDLELQQFVIHIANILNSKFESRCNFGAHCTRRGIHLRDKSKVVSRALRSILRWRWITFPFIQKLR